MQNVDGPELRRRALACPYLHGDNDLTEDLEKLAKRELNEDEETRVRSLEELRARLKDESGLAWQDDDPFLLAFLRARKFCVDRTFRLVKGYYGTAGKYADVFYGVDQGDVTRSLLQNNLYILPRRDSDGCSVGIFRFSTWDPRVVSPELLLGAGNLCIWHVLRHHSTHIAGYKIIFDYEGLGLKHLACIRPWHLWLYSEILQNAHPFRLRGIHLVNQNKFFQSMWVIMRQFISKKLTERVHFHGKAFESLHQFIDPGILPAEYGGKQPSFDNSDMRRVVESSEAYSEYVLSFGYERFLKSTARKKKSWKDAPREKETGVNGKQRGASSAS